MLKTLKKARQKMNILSGCTKYQELKILIQYL